MVGTGVGFVVGVGVGAVVGFGVGSAVGAGVDVGFGVAAGAALSLGAALALASGSTGVGFDSATRSCPDRFVRLSVDPRDSMRAAPRVLRGRPSPGP